VDSRHTDHGIMNCMHNGYPGVVNWGPHTLALYPPLAASPMGSLVGRRSPPHLLYKSPLGGEFDTSGLRKFLRRAPLSSPPHTPLLSSLSLCLLYGSPKGYIGARATPSLHNEVLREFRIGSKAIYFHNLGLIRDPEGVNIRHMCTSTTRCCMRGTDSLHQCRGVKIFTTLRSATSSSSSMLVREHNLRVRSTTVRL
jgi:hypothetical protein